MPVGIQMPQMQREEEPTSSKIAKAVQMFAGAHESAMDRKFKEQQAARQAELDLKNDERYDSDQERKAAQQEKENLYRERELAIKEKDAGKKKEVDPTTALLREYKLQKAKDDADKAAFAKTPAGRLKEMNSMDRQRYDNSILGLGKIQEMDKALVNGDNTFNLIGDNNYTESLRLSAEAFGRMQSGGAINKEEEARFIAMAPTWRDTPEIQRRKLESMQKLYTDRLNTLGFTPDEAGVPLTEIGYAKPALTAPVAKGGLILPNSLMPQANAGSVEMTPPAPPLPPPKVGLIRNGYKFRGGDETNQANWEKVK